MSRRFVQLIISMLLVVLVGIATEFVTSDPIKLPSVLQAVRSWSVPLLVVTVLLLVGGTVWQYLLEHPVPLNASGLDPVHLILVLRLLLSRTHLCSSAASRRLMSWSTGCLR